MKSRPLLLTLLLLWCGVFALSFIAPHWIAPTGDGFTRGLNRLGLLFLFQAGAFLLAIFVALLGWKHCPKTKQWRWLCTGPLGVHLSLFLLVIGFVLFSRLNKPDPASPAALQPTAPAAPAVVTPPVDRPSLPHPATRTFQGLFRSGFEHSHFYSMEGEGPYWLEAGESDWATLQSHFVDGPGRSGGVTVALIVEGYLTDTPADLVATTGTRKTLHVTALPSIRPLTPEEFERILKAVRP